MNKLIKHIIILFMLCVGYTAYGQLRPYRVIVRPARPFNNRQINRANSENRVEAVKERFIRNQLNLPPDQAQRFFPLYQEYQQEMFNIRRLKRVNSTSASANGTEQINRELYYDNQIVQIRMRFNNAFLKVLPPEKVSELYKSEREFNDELVRSLSERSSIRAGN